MKFRIIKETRHDRPNHPRYYVQYESQFWLFKKWTNCLLINDLLCNSGSRKYFLTEKEAEDYIEKFKAENKRLILAARPPVIEVVKEIE